MEYKEMVGAIKAKEIKNPYEFFCRDCKRPKDQPCSASGLMTFIRGQVDKGFSLIEAREMALSADLPKVGYCDQHPLVVPEGYWLLEVGINWADCIFGSLEDAESFMEFLRGKHRHDKPRYYTYTIEGALQVTGYGVHYHMYD